MEIKLDVYFRQVCNQLCIIFIAEEMSKGNISMLQQKDIDKILAKLLPTKDEKQHFEQCESALRRLNILIHSFHLKYPFQNLTLLSKEIGTQTVPTLEEIKKDGLDFKGGLCYTNNIFFYHLLKGLGYDAYNIAGTCNPSHPNNHIATLVRNVSEHGDRYLVDVGCGYPTYQAILLNFENESPVYESGFLQYKFLNKGSSCYERQHLQNFSKDGTNFEKATEGQMWARYYDFSIVPRELDYFKPAMSEVYEDRFLRKFRILKFTDTNMSALKEEDPDIVLLTLSCGGSATRKDVKPDELVSTVREMFPLFSKESIDLAYQHWKHFRI